MRKIDRASRSSRAAILAFLTIALTANASPDGGKPPKVVAASDAKNHIDEHCTVEMTVRASKNAFTRRGDSEYPGPVARLEYKGSTGGGVPSPNLHNRHDASIW